MRKHSYSILVLMFVVSLGIITSGNTPNLLKNNIFKADFGADAVFANTGSDEKAIYFILFHHLAVIKEKNGKESGQGELPVDYLELYKSNASLSDFQTRFLFQTAEECMNEIKPLEAEMNAIVKNSRNKYPNREVAYGEDIPQPPKELKELWEQKDKIVLKYKENLENMFGEEKFADFNDFATKKIAPNINYDIFNANSQTGSRENTNQFNNPPPINSGCYGYSLYDVDSNNPAIIRNMETGTVLYCSLVYYYDPGIQSFLYNNNELISTLPRQICQNCSTVYHYTGQFTGDVGRTYKIKGDHYLAAYTIIYYGGQPYWYDHYGMNFYQGTYPTPYGFSSGQPAAYTYNIYRAASTEISYTVPQPPVHLTSIDHTGFPPVDDYVTALRGTGLVGPNQTVQVTGSGVTAQISGGQSNEILDIIVDVAENAQRGERQLTLMVNGVTSNALTFTVGDNSPLINNMTPPQANTGETVSVAISGSNFGLNPQIQIIGTGVQPAITSSTATEINALFSVADAATAGQRGVRVRSLGYSGTGFQPVPGTSDTSNITDFTVIANPSVSIPEIGSIEKGTVRIFNVTISNAPDNHVTKFSFNDRPLPPSPTRPADGWKTGEARFDDGSSNGLRELSFTGSGEKEIKIRGWERSSSRNNIKLEARFNNDTNVKKSRDFTVSSVEFVEEDSCSGYDDIEFERTRNNLSRFLYVPKGGTNKIKAKIVPSGASGTFDLTTDANSNIAISPNVISSTNEQLLTVTSASNSSVGSGYGIQVKSNNVNVSTREAEFVFLHVMPRREKNVVIHRVTEENDDVQGPSPSSRSADTICVVSGPNLLLDTVKEDDDVERTDPTGATTLQVITAGPDTRCDTRPNSDNVTSPNPPSVASLQDFFDKTWDRQSNIHLNVSLTVQTDVVNFDLDRDGKLKHPNIGQDEAIKIDANKVAGAINLYYLGTEITPRATGATQPAAVASYPLDRAFFSLSALENFPASHETGHLLGRSGHNPELPEYVNTLMYFSYSPGSTSCRITEADLNLVQLNFVP